MDRATYYRERRKSMAQADLDREERDEEFRRDDYRRKDGRGAGFARVFVDLVLGEGVERHRRLSRLRRQAGESGPYQESFLEDVLFGGGGGKGRGRRRRPSDWF